MEKLKSFIQSTLLGGLIVILPVAILVVVFNWLYNLISGLINPLTGILISQYGFHSIVADILVILIIIFICFFVGVFIRTRFGRFLHNTIEQRILRVAPGYTLIKETVMQILGNKQAPFSRVVLAQIFENSSMVTGFVTDEHDDGTVSVFVPTGPNPTSGMIYHVKANFVHPVDVSVEEAMRSIISCGAGSAKLIAEYRQKLK